MKTKFLIPLAGLALFCACKGKSSSYEADSVKSFTKEKSISHTGDTVQNDKKPVKTANMRFKVKNVQQTSEQIAALTASCSGTVIHHFINSTTSDSVKIQKSNDSLLKITVINTAAEMTVKVPPAKMENFVNQVAKMGIMVNMLKMDINDKSLEYLSNQLKLKNQKEMVDNRKGSANVKDPDNLLAFKNNMVDQQINNLKTDDSTKNSIIILSFYENSVVNREFIANPDLTAYNSSISERLGVSVKNGWQVFINIIVGLANLWVLLPIGLGVWMIVRYYSKRKKPAVNP